MRPDTLSVDGAYGSALSVRVELPIGRPAGIALFVHCLTCGKDLFAARAIARGLAIRGFLTARFDFTGLGASGGDFASTDFSANVEDVVRVAEALGAHYGGPQLLVGHSIGGAAAILAARRLPQVTAVATIGAPASADPVLKHLAADPDPSAADGVVPITLGGRSFTVRREFLDDISGHKVEEAARAMDAAFLVLHAPLDQMVGIDNATRLFLAAHHPRSFISLDAADHLLERDEDARYAADVVAAWASRYVIAPEAPELPEGTVRAEDAGGPFRTLIATGGHAIPADEPRSAGGEDTGPSPYDLLAAGLAACTLMTLRLYGARKGWTVEASVDVVHEKVHAEDVAEATVKPGADGRIDLFRRMIHFASSTPPDQRKRLLEIADRCPVHRTLERGAAIITTAV
ncbi:alpha/beta fold hydrolase [Acuticoccus mangrovi]|uniref:Alpha/beta fold hydrolase n=1 Tax=Acuticoccus mangrovi TaxID=2796142 RepID=A0A934ILS8_9HYPH|nr:alpha/beta fold hydrolase [Acuticoccus mangrovi]MBJ3774756.1 alpha/beta fold hydrolase [Acuticoccus mangrovi]